MNRISCPICGALHAEFFAFGRDRLFGVAAGSFELRRCADCGCIFQRTTPDSQMLADFYPQTYWWSQPSRRGNGPSLVAKLEKIYREFVVLDHVRFLERCACRNGSKKATLLDIGCGSGTFLAAAARKGFQAHGMDLSARAVELARSQYGLDVRQGTIQQDIWTGRRFDFITMFHVLEHLPDPKGALACVERLLAPGGTLIVQVPNAAAIQASLFRERWYGFDVPRHVVNFTPRSLGVVLRQTGFRASVATRFSLRDNPAALASSVAPGLDPIGRKGRRGSSPAREALSEFAYFGLVILAFGPAVLESALGRGATIWACARRVTDISGQSR